MANKNIQINQDNGHGSYKSYIIGFILSIILTVIPYKIVVDGLLDSDLQTIIAITIFALGQFLVQVIFFLHLGDEAKPRWNLLAFIFTIIVIAILVAGSLWIMYNLNYNMMDH